MVGLLTPCRRRIDTSSAISAFDPADLDVTEVGLEKPEQLVIRAGADSRDHATGGSKKDPPLRQDHPAIYAKVRTGEISSFAFQAAPTRTKD
jgi:hypothetical protein